MQYISGRRISQDFGIPDFTTNDTVVNVDGRIAVGIGESATANIDTNSIRIREDILDFDGFSGEFGYFLSKDADGLKWVAVTPIQSNSIFISENSDFVGVSSFTGFNIISDQLLGISTNPDNSTIADIRIDPRWFRDRTPGGGGGIYTTGTVGIGLTQPRLGPVGILTEVKLDVLGDAIFSGVVSARSFVGEFDIDTQNLNVSGLATFKGEDDNTLGDPDTGAVQIDGGVGINKNVSIGASLFVNTLVGIGTSTNLDDNALTINGGNVDILGDNNTVKIGTAVTIGNGIVSATTGDFTNLELDNLDVSGIATINSGIITNLKVTGFSTFGNTARFDGAVNIFDNLFVSGNISVGGTGVTLDTETIRIEGQELLIGFTTTITPNDDTANAAGIAVASTEGYFLADLQAGLNTTPNTYKQFKWFKNETFSGQGTDAFISNQPISIGNTQIGNGVVFSAGNLNVKSDESTLGVVKISSGIITNTSAGVAVTVYGNLIGTASTASFATTAFNLDSPETLSVGFATTATNVIGGIASVTQLSVNNTGISTLGVVEINAGIITNTSAGVAVTVYGELIGTASTASFASTAFNLIGTASTASFASTAFNLIGTASTASFASTAFNLIGTASTASFASTAFNLIGTASTASFASTAFNLIGTASTASFASTAFNLIGTASTASFASTAFNLIGTASTASFASTAFNLIGTASTASFASTAFNLIGTASTASFASTAFNLIGTASTASFATTAFTINGGATGQILYQSGVSTTGFLTTGSENQILVSKGPGFAPAWESSVPSGASGIQLQDDGIPQVGVITSINFVGAPVSVATSLSGIGTVTITVDAPGSVGFATTATNVIGGIASVTQLSVNTTGISTLGVVEINAGIITNTSAGVAVTVYGELIGTASTASFASTAFNLIGTASTASFASTAFNLIGTASTASFASTAFNLIGTASTASFASTAFNLIGTASTASFASTAFNLIGTASTASFASTAFNLIGTASTASFASTAFNLIGTASTASFASTAFNLIGTASTASFASTAFNLIGTASTASFASTAFNLIGTASTASFASTAFNLIGTASTASFASTAFNLIGTASTASFASTAFNLIGTASTASFASTAFNLDSPGGISVGFATTATNVIGGIASVTQLSVNTTGISTLGVVKIYSGIITASEPSGIITYYGDGSKLANIISGVGIQSGGTSVGSGFTTLNFLGIGNTIITNPSNDKIVDITINAPATTRNSSSTTVEGDPITEFGGAQYDIVNGEPYIDVFVNGVRINSTDFTATDGSTITLNGAVSPDSIVELVGYTDLTLTDENLFSLRSGITTNIEGGQSGNIVYQSGPTVTDFVSSPLNENVVLGYNTNTNAPEWLSQLSIQALNVSNDLFVSGNITIGGTGVTLDTETIRIEGKELLIGFTTTQTPNDDTANAAGIAIASTEGYFLADLQAGLNTSPNTYKQFKWFRGGINATFTGQGTDAFISNQPISIGNTQIGNGVVFSAGNLNVKSDESTLGVVKISSGIITASEPSGIITYYGELGLGVSIASSIRDSSGSFGSNGQVLAVTSSGLAYTSIESPTSVGSATTSTNVIGGIASVTQLSVNNTGISTLGVVEINAGIITNTSAGVAVTVYGELIGTASTASFASTAFNLIGTASTASFASTAFNLIGTASTASFASTAFNLIGTASTASFASTAFNLIGTASTASFASTAFNLIGTASTASFASTAFNLIGTASTASFASTAFNLIGTASTASFASTAFNLIGTASTASFASTAFNLDSPETLSVGFATTATNVIGGIASVTQLSVNTTGISTLGVVKIYSGIITASEPSGIITYYGELGLGVSIASSIRDSSGSFGSDGQVLAVTSSGLAYTTFTADASSVTVEDITSGTYYVGAWENTGSQAKAYVETTNPVVITSDGRIGIGSTDPTAKLDVDGGVIVSGVVTATDFNSTSDARLKTNIKIIDNPTEKVLRIDGVSFNWIKDNKSSIGVIADNIQEVLPQLVSDTNPKTVNYNGLIGLLIEVVKEQQSQIESLSERISRLE